MHVGTWDKTATIFERVQGSGAVTPLRPLRRYRYAVTVTVHLTRSRYGDGVDGAPSGIDVP